MALFFNVDESQALRSCQGTAILQAIFSSAPLPDAFGDGVVHCAGHERARSGLPSATAQRATVFSYIVDWSWFVPACPPSCELTVCANWVPETRDTEEPIARFAAGLRRVVVCGRAIDVLHAEQGQGLMHGKLFIVEFADFVRIVISTANLTLDDFCNLGQAFWTVDVPVRDSGEPFVSFGAQLTSLLRALDMHRLSDRMIGFDLDSVHASLVVSLPRCFTEEEEVGGSDDESGGVAPRANQRRRFNGHLGLDSLRDAVAWARAALSASTLAELDAPHSPVWYQASSIGGITNELLARFESAVAGASATPAQLHALFPSCDVVRAQLASGNVGAITLRCFQGDGNTLARDRWHTLNTGTRAFHTKLIYHVRPDNGAGWMYLGSHNFTPDSWCATRRAVPEGTSADPRNIEIGVVVRLRAADSPGGGDPSVVRLLPPAFFPSVPSPISFKDAFVFLKHRELIKGARESLPLDGGPTCEATQLTYHWIKFLAEYSNPYGRH